MKNMILGILFISILVLAGCSSQTVVKYQCADGSFVDSADLCSVVECQTNCPELDCSNCPVKTETKTVEKEVIKYQCNDGTIKNDLAECPAIEEPEVEELSDYEKYRMEQERIEYGVQDQEELYYIVENMPTFQGEDSKEFRKYIAQNVQYPQNAVKNGVTGKVFVQFVVNSDGNVTNVIVPESVDKDLDKEAIRVVEASPKWKPGVQRGVAVNVQFTFPINFVLDEQVASNDEATTIVNNYYIDNNNLKQ